MQILKENKSGEINVHEKVLMDFNAYISMADNEKNFLKEIKRKGEN